MEDSDSQSPFALSSLLCQETETCFDEDAFLTLTTLNTQEEEEEEDDEYVHILLERETSCFELEKHQTSHILISHWIKRARMEAITWILNTSALFGFQFQTAYLSVTYLDRFLSRRIIDGGKYWAVWLLSVACLSLSAKMEEFRVPSLSEFPLEDFKFESKVIKRMELLVLHTLEWRMCYVTPFDYIHYFISKLCKDFPSSDVILSTTVGTILATLMTDNNLMDCRPSVIAGAATLVALDQKLTRQALEYKINASFPNWFLQIEDVLSCYTQMQALDMEKTKFPNYIKSPDLSPIQMRTNDLENSSITSSFTTKRKKLPFNDDDQNYDIREKKRHG